MDKVIAHVLNTTTKEFVNEVVFEMLSSYKQHYNYNKIKNRILKLLVDESEYLTMSDINREECQRVIHTINPNAQNVEFDSFNNITMELLYYYTAENGNYRICSYISAFDYPEIIRHYNNEYD